MKEIIAATRDLTKIYGSTEALVHMNLNVKRGQILGLIGDNGAGKTTLLKMLAGQIYPNPERNPGKGKSGRDPEGDRPV